MNLLVLDDGVKEAIHLYPSLSVMRPERWLSYLIAAPSQAQDANCSLDGEDAASTSRSAVLCVKDSARFPSVLQLPFLHASFSILRMSYPESKRVLATLVLCTSRSQRNGMHKVMRRKFSGSYGHFILTPQVPLDLRLVKKDYFIW
ncbi:hypothetical protein DFJ58DRAFT_727985 [Suillus subalutaceus]|uniref:uncharacterized protein n=1 Tax=Suillus subalutaceus TaxID=48586 RepID=UPI001B87A4C5|nr:uncharacterized protein DFJ58DRAFT_727985 [Suillus subalutaceus]KAG1854198.1 hypothetical protein DFJ58DRAFT_727985 [Suillus subalutaceus]